MSEVNQTTYQSIGDKKMSFKDKFKKKGKTPVKGDKPSEDNMAHDAIKGRMNKEKC